MRIRYAKRAQLDKVLLETEGITEPHSIETSLIDLSAVIERVIHFHQEIRKLVDVIATGIPSDLLDEELKKVETFNDKVLTVAAKLRCHIINLEYARSSETWTTSATNAYQVRYELP